MSAESPNMDDGIIMDLRSCWKDLYGMGHLSWQGREHCGNTVVTERLAIPTWAMAGGNELEAKLGSPSIAISRVPAPWAHRVSLFTVIPHPVLSK